MIGFSFASDWLKKWREFFGPITEGSKGKTKNSRFTFENYPEESYKKFQSKPKDSAFLFRWLLMQY